MRTATVTVGEGPTLDEVAGALERTLGVPPVAAAPELEFDVGVALWLLSDDTELEDSPAYTLDLVAPRIIQDTESRRLFDALVDTTDWWVQLWADDNRVLVDEWWPTAPPGAGGAPGVRGWPAPGTQRRCLPD